MQKEINVMCIIFDEIVCDEMKGNVGKTKANMTNPAFLW
ncbi:hypothetical protein KCO_21384 [Pectobacterium brasiliense ICMP 19477]|nr:hypothetical protein KCO_21384 [Pectobacterium brasiliense ICMP 19477]